jgi:hypothetical protein
MFLQILVFRRFLQILAILLLPMSLQILMFQRILKFQQIQLHQSFH